MNNYTTANDDEETNLLIQGLLSSINADDMMNVGFNEAKKTTQDIEIKHVETKASSDIGSVGFDWEFLSDAEDDDVVCLRATEEVPSFSQTVDIDEVSRNVKSIFLEKIPVGKKFVDKHTARVSVQEISNDCNIPFVTEKSDKEYIKMVCKHYGDYRSGVAINAGTTEK